MDTIGRGFNSTYGPAEETVFFGGGVMGELMRTHDWAASPLGPVCNWLPSLRTAVSLALNSQFPIVIFWGPDLVMLYNDAYLPMLADKHPTSLGRPAREVWSEIWSIVGPMLHSVLETGQATWSYNLLLPIVHKGVTGEYYFTFSYSAIRDDAGNVCGVFCPVTETTAHLLNERREQYLRAEAETARERLTTTLESITDAFYTLDRQWRFTYVNRRAKEIWRRLDEDFIGKNVWEEFPESERLIFAEQLRIAVAEQKTVDCEGFYPPLGIWLALHAYPSAEGLAVYFRDVTTRKQTEEGLREQEARLRLALEAAVMGVWAWHLPTNRVSWSPEVYQLFGVDNFDGTAEGFWRFVHPEDIERTRAAVMEAIRNQTQYEGEFRIYCGDGTIRWVANRGRAEYDAQGAPVRLLGVVMDLTANKEAEAALRESEGRFRALANTAPGMVWIAAPDGTITYANEQWFTFCGLTPDQNTSAWPQLVLHPEDRERCLAQWTRALAQGTPYEIEARNRRADGVYRWLLTRAVPVHDAKGRISVWYGTTTDIHDRKQAEAEREHLIAELQRTNEEFQQFSHIVSHDLTEPLRTMNNFVQLLAHHLKESDSRTTEYMNFITDAAERMKIMLNDLLAYTRVGQEPQFDIVDCEGVLLQVQGVLQQRITESDAIITHDPLPKVQGDAIRLGQVFQNLIGNALKFCKQQPHIHISAVKDRNHWRFSVRDNGIGIDPAQSKRLFQVFQRLHSRKEYGGTGIGLAICKRIVEQHGGRIWVESQLGNGAMFNFTISDIRT